MQDDMTGTDHQSPLPVPGSRRGKPGRPRKGDQGIYGHKVGTVLAELQAESGESVRAPVMQTAVVSIAPRLLDLSGTAAYLGVSTWKIRELEGAGTLSRVRIPLGPSGELRKLLFDRSELDRLIDQWKDPVKI